MNVLSHISSNEDYEFIKKFQYPFHKKGIEISYVVTNVETFIRLKLCGEDVSYVKRVKSSEKYEDSFNERVGYLKNATDAGITYFSFVKWLRINYPNKKWDLFIIPSGRMVSHQALTAFAKKNKIKTIYIGYGNFPGKTILDPIGTDRDSSLFYTPEVLDRYEVDELYYKQWRESYIIEKEKSQTIPQARDINFSFIIKRLVRTAICKLDNILGIAHDIDYNFLDLDISTYLFNKNVALNFINVEKIEEPFAFFAMQLSTDTQIIQNYEYDIYHALNRAITIAKEKKIQLVVKPHPAEVSVEIANHLNSLENDGIILLTNSNTISTIKRSEFVMVVNSTVGLEAKILNKEVIFFGLTLFSHLSDKRIMSYITNYLFNIEYFSSDDVSELELNKVIDRLF